MKADGSSVDFAYMKMSMISFDEIAVEDAIRLKEVGKAEEIAAVSVGVNQNQETLRTALAMGADRANLLVVAVDMHQSIEPLAVAKILNGIVDKKAPGQVFCDEQAINNDMNATGQMLASLMGWSQATLAKSCALDQIQYTPFLDTLRVK